MTTAAFNLTFDNTSDATFRVWAAALDAQILAMGWVHTTDTGQANLTTMTRTVTIATNYTVYKTNDGVSPPIILKVEWSMGGSLTAPGISLSVGFATDGAGNLTGTAISGRFSQTTSTSSDTSPRTCIISGTTSRLGFALNMNAVSTANSSFFSVERNKTSVGADTNTGAIILFHGGSGGSAQIAGAAATMPKAGMLYLPTTGGVPSAEVNGLPCALTGNAALNNTFGGTVGAAVPIPLAGAAQNPGLGMLVCNSVEQPTRDTTITATMYDGSAHTYYAIGPNFTNIAGCAGSSQAATRSLMRFE